LLVSTTRVGVVVAGIGCLAFRKVSVLGELVVKNQKDSVNILVSFSAQFHLGNKRASERYPNPQFKFISLFLV
jgi:hypothetical protein